MFIQEFDGLSLWGKLSIAGMGIALHAHALARLVIQSARFAHGKTGRDGERRHSKSLHNEGGLS